MKKILITLCATISLVGVFRFSGQSFAKDKYYSNGVYYGRHTCHVNWKEARHSIGSIMYHGWINGLGEVLGGVSGWGK